MPRKYTRRDPEELFWANVDKSGECWLWIASIKTTGYGGFNVNKRQVGAHRYSYELAYGPIPPGMQVLHRCHVKSCVRPDHLFLGTDAERAQENIDRMPRGKNHWTQAGKHQPVERKKETPADKTLRRFWENVERSEGCWIWIGGKSGEGYGSLSVNKHAMKAHRYSYELHYGPIPSDLFVCHKCDTPACVRPDHLFLGTHTDNMRDAQAKGRLAFGSRSGMHTHPESRSLGDRNGSRKHPDRLMRGEQGSSAKLTEQIVRDIRSRYAAGGVSLRQLASEYGVNYTHISSIINRRTWKHI